MEQPAKRESYPQFLSRLPDSFDEHNHVVKPRFIFILFVLGILGVLIVCTRQPRYHGRTLASWLQQYSYTALDEPQRRQEAQNAVSAIGAKKALPKLLNLVEAKDDPVSLWLIERTDEFRIRFLRWSSSEQYSYEDLQRIRWHSAEDFQQLGIVGFEILGTNAAPAAGKLEGLLGEKDHAFTAERCLVFVGKPAEPVFCRALTNQDAAIRQWAIDELASVTDDVEVYIARIKPRLQDSSDAVRGTAVNDIGIQTSAPELAVPLLISALKDSAVSANAANTLGNFGTNALVAFPILTNLVEHGDTNVAGAALKTLIVIAPDRALPIFTNYLAQGKPWVDAALRALTEVMPDKALPMVLARLQSPNLAMRREAFGLLRHYPVTSQIDSAMQTVVTDSDSALALAAKGFLTAQYATNHPDAFLFPDEPSYNGKRLGEWLETRIEGGGDFIPAAKDAIHQVGTNAIPALLKRLTYVRPPYCFNPFQININAAGGFIALGEQAKPALPELWLLMDSTNKDTALTAMIATCGTGSNAMPFLIKGLTNPFANVRGLAANILMEGVGDKFPEQRKQAIPLFVKLLNDPDEDIRRNATNQLKEIDPQTAARQE
jgi:HEAT repeat protein